MAFLPFVYRFEDDETRIYLLISGLDLRGCPKLRVTSFRELWAKYWHHVHNVAKLNYDPETPKGKTEDDYRKAFNTLFEADEHPPVYPVVYNNDTSLLFKALGLGSEFETPDSESRKVAKKVSFSEKDQVKVFDVRDEDEEDDEPPKVVAKKSAAKATLGGETKTKGTPKAGGGSRSSTGGGKKAALPKVTLLPFPERKAWPYALVGDTKELREFLKFPDLASDKGPKPSMYVTNVNKEFGPGWNLKEEAVEAIREADESKLSLVECEDLDEYRSSLE